MPDNLTDYVNTRLPTPDQPLAGLTILVVEDSRFASEALRLMGLRSGARIRRADCLNSARRHLHTYRPGVAIIDVGLPDGSGLDLIGELAALPDRTTAILATSGDPDVAARAMTAGADAFLAKPIEGFGAFCRTVLSVVPAAHPGPRALRVDDDAVHPDTLALRDDLSHAARLLDDAPDGRGVDYIAQFLSGIAKGAADSALEAAASDLARARSAGTGFAAGLARLSGLVEDRLKKAANF